MSIFQTGLLTKKRTIGPLFKSLRRSDFIIIYLYFLSETDENLSHSLKYERH